MNKTEVTTNGDLGHWIVDGEIPTIVPFGFIYCVTNKQTNIKYIGKKQCLTIKKRPALKGKKRKRSELCQTDWRQYTSSSNTVNTDIERLGKNQFEFRILRFCKNKAELAYFEIEEQIKREALLRPNEYYNGIINVRVGRRGLPLHE